ncbi:MAG: hypothetical protein NT076_02145 [Candidatus Pacearchaeota archaeon]|nr:hypothetical protein [Candidatus Pacearchaeota archaeon]
MGIDKARELSSGRELSTRVDWEGLASFKARCGKKDKKDYVETEDWLLGLLEKRKLVIRSYTNVYVLLARGVEVGPRLSYFPETILHFVRQRDAVAYAKFFLHGEEHGHVRLLREVRERVNL